jgi:hypothetical protein
MEVHAHSHTARKKWTHYFWEFLMLFLAVFCGFLAEYQLEHVIENQREKQYMISMVEDLKSDALMLKNNVEQRKRRMPMVDSLIFLLNLKDRNNYGSDIHFLGRSISPPLNIFPNDRTIQQLKGSGNLRLIRNKNVSNSIMAYDQKMRNSQFEMGDEVQIRAEYRQAASKVFNTTVFSEISGLDMVTRPVGNPSLFSTDPLLINELIGAAQYIKRIHRSQMNISEELLNMNIQLMALIKKEYHLQ